jgi:hypothetical protein
MLKIRLFVRRQYFPNPPEDLKIQVWDPGSGKTYFGSRAKKAPDPRSGSATLQKIFVCIWMHNIVLNNNCLPGLHTDPPPGLPDSAAGRRQLQGAQERLQVPAEVIHPPSPPPSSPSNRATQIVLQQILLDRLQPAVNQLSFCKNVPRAEAVLQSSLSACHSLPTSSRAPPFLLYPL